MSGIAMSYSTQITGTKAHVYEVSDGVNMENMVSVDYFGRIFSLFGHFYMTVWMLQNLGIKQKTNRSNNSTSICKYKASFLELYDKCYVQKKNILSKKKEFKIFMKKE